MTGRSGNPAKRAWQPMQKASQVNPELIAVHRRLKLPIPHEAWGNNLYQCVVHHQNDGWTHLSIKRHDRAAVRDWRHFQQIKNEVVGPGREAIEVYPAEDRLVDTANEYALWVLPEGSRLTVGWQDRMVLDPTAMEQLNAAMVSPSSGKGRQRPWQAGLTTGGTR